MFRRLGRHPSQSSLRSGVPRPPSRGSRNAGLTPGDQHLVAAGGLNIYGFGAASAINNARSGTPASIPGRAPTATPAESMAVLNPQLPGYGMQYGYPYAQQPPNWPPQGQFLDPRMSTPAPVGYPGTPQGSQFPYQAFPGQAAMPGFQTPLQPFPNPGTPVNANWMNGQPVDPRTGTPLPNAAMWAQQGQSGVAQTDSAAPQNGYPKHLNPFSNQYSPATTPQGQSVAQPQPVRPGSGLQRSASRMSARSGQSTGTQAFMGTLSYDMAKNGYNPAAQNSFGNPAALQNPFANTAAPPTTFPNAASRRGSASSRSSGWNSSVGHGARRPHARQGSVSSVRSDASTASSKGIFSANSILETLQRAANYCSLTNFYAQSGHSGVLRETAQWLFKSRAPQKIRYMWDFDEDSDALSMCTLGLFDIFMLVDDSGSMRLEDGGQRIKDLQNQLARLAPACAIFDTDGYDLFFLHEADNPPMEHVREKSQIDQLFDRKSKRKIKWAGGTPLGMAVQRIQQRIEAILRNGGALKPFLMYIYTDGQPEQDGPNERIKGEEYLVKVIYDFFRVLRQYELPDTFVSYMFVQVGDDQTATALLERLDKHELIGHVVDCTSTYEKEDAEVKRADVKRRHLRSIQEAKGLSIEKYLRKLALGAVTALDKEDESCSNSRSSSVGYWR